MNSAIKYKIFLLSPVLLSFFISTGQVTISGPQCVVKELECQYKITGEWNGSNISICAQGGVLTENNASCVQKTSVSFVRVRWTTGSNGTLSVTSSAGNASLSVSITTELNVGVISDNSKSQTINFNMMPAVIYCSAASGGSCNASYAYQWQESADNVTWTDMSGKTSQNLTFTASLTGSKFFRRKITEATSGTVMYSGYAAVYVNPAMNGQ